MRSVQDQAAVCAFLDGERDRSWQYLDGLEVYLRKGIRVLSPNQAAQCLVIANVEATVTGVGRFSEFLEVVDATLLERHTPRCVLIENVTPARWAAHLLRIGFKQVRGFAGDEIPSFYRAAEP